MRMVLPLAVVICEPHTLEIYICLLLHEHAIRIVRELDKPVEPHAFVPLSPYLPSR